MRTIRLLLVLFVCAVPAAADTIYQVTGSGTITGNNSCNGPCTETIDFSFLVSYTLAYPGIVSDAYDVHFFSVLSLASFGPLAPFNTLVAVGGGDYFALFNATHDEIDLDGPFADGLFAPRPFPDLVNIELYGCGGGVAEVSPICVQDFAFNPDQFYGHVSFGPIEYTVSTVATPEGSTRLHLLVGVGLGLLGMHAVTRVR